MKTLTLSFKKWTYGGSKFRVHHFKTTHNIGDFNYIFEIHKHLDRVYFNRTKWTPFVIVTWKIQKIK